MKHLKTLLTATLFASVAITGTAQADSPISNLIWEESTNIFTVADYERSTQEGTHSYGDDYNQDSVWSFEYEQYVNPADFVAHNSPDNAHGINRYMESNPTASGQSGNQVFKWDATYDGYMLQ